MEKKRNLNLDVLRCIALIYVLCVHFFHNANFYYYSPVMGTAMELSVILRNCFASCVPLFLTLTGYLMNRKKLSARFYTGISKVLIIYGLSCIAVWIFRTIEYGDTFTLDTLLKSFLAYEGYAWYIGLYIGLYALIPFLNVMYHGLGSKKQKLLLVCILIVFTALPSFTNKFGANIIPQNYELFFPITYYFIGAYLSEYEKDVKLSPWILFLLYVIVIISGGMFVNQFVRGKMYYSVMLFVDWGNILNTCSTILLFLTILKCDFSKVPAPIAKLIETISQISLQMYLVSWIFDQIVYVAFNAKYPIYDDRFAHIFEPIIQVFLGSFIVSLVIQFIYNQIKKLSS